MRSSLRHSLRRVGVAKRDGARGEAVSELVTHYFHLREGDVFLHSGREYVVDMVNPSRARCLPLERKKVEYVTADEKTVKFETDHAIINISPNSEVEILRRLGPNWRAVTGQKVVAEKVKPATVSPVIAGLPPKRGRGRPRK